MAGIDRQVLQDLVLRWQRSEITEREVHEEAERLWTSASATEYQRTDSRSIALEVLAQLEILNHQLITVDDVPAILDFLSTPGGGEEVGWKRWENYWTSVDFDARRMRLRKHPYYAV